MKKEPSKKQLQVSLEAALREIESLRLRVELVTEARDEFANALLELNGLKPPKP